MFNAINSYIVQEFNFNAEQIGYLGSFYFYGNVLFLFPAGMLLDRFSVRNLLIAVFAVSIIASYIFSTTSTFWIMNATRFVIGLTGAFSLLAAVKLASRWFESCQMALVVGIVVTLAMFGGAIAQTPLALLAQKIGWRQAMQVVVGLGIVLVIAQIILVRNEPKGLEKAKEYDQTEAIGFWKALRISITNGQNWLSGIYICLINLPLFILGGIWGVPYLIQVHHLTQLQATEVTTMLFVGMMIGSPLAGVVSDRMGLRKLPMIIGAILSIGTMLVIMFSPTVPLWAEICQFFFLGIFAGSQVIGYPVIAKNNPPSITATATSLASTLVVGGGMLIQPYSWLLGLSGDTIVVDNITTYSLADFTRANYLMLIGLVIALAASLLIRETYCRQVNKS